MEVEIEQSPAPLAELGKAKCLTRFYQSKDREAVRKICADTGFLGSPIDPVFEDREIFADYLTEYYTDAEPESTLVAEIDGQIVGYLMGSRLIHQYKRYRMGQNLQLFLRGGFRYFNRPYNDATRRYVKWLFTQAAQQSPYTPEGMPHFHINLLPQARSVSQTRSLINQFLAYLSSSGEKSVYAQIVTYDKRRGPRMFERYGFKVVDQVEVTKFRWLRPDPIFLFTVIKDLTINTQLYGYDLRKIEE